MDPVLLSGAVVAVVLILLLVKRQRLKYAQQVGTFQPGVIKRSKVKKEFNIYTREEVAKHNKRDDAWVIIKDRRTGDNKVYDLTDYVEEHPGGDSILNHVGGDTTEGFHGPQHPDTVFVMVEEYLIGKLAADQ